MTPFQQQQAQKILSIYNNVDQIVKSDKDELEKGGEGSRGGKVVGHTKSGKAIYETKEVAKDIESYSNHLTKHGVEHHKGNGKIVVSPHDYEHKIKPGIMSGSGHTTIRDTYHTHGTGFAVQPGDVEKEKKSHEKWLAGRKKEEETRAQKHSENLKRAKELSGDSTLKHDGYDDNNRPIYISNKKGEEDIEYTIDKKGNVYRHDGVKTTKLKEK